MLHHLEREPLTDRYAFFLVHTSRSLFLINEHPSAFFCYACLSKISHSVAGCEAKESLVHFPDKLTLLDHEGTSLPPNLITNDLILSV